MNDKENKIIGIIQMLINMGDEAFSKEEVEEFIEHQVKIGGVAEDKAKGLTNVVEERDKRHNLDKEERVSGIIEMLVNLNEGAYPKGEIVDFVKFLIEKGSISQEKGNVLIAKIENMNTGEKLEELKKQIPQ